MKAGLGSAVRVRCLLGVLVQSGWWGAAVVQALGAGGMHRLWACSELGGAADIVVLDLGTGV